MRALLNTNSAASAALTAHEDVVIALLGAFATFSAFGIAVAGFLAAGGAVQTVAAWWTQHGRAEARQREHDTRTALKLAGWRFPGLIILAALTIALVVGISGAGLLLSYHWFHVYAEGKAASMNSTYRWLIRLFVAEVVLFMGVTLATVIGTAWSTWNAQKSADRSENAGDEIEKAARQWLDPGDATGQGAGLRSQGHAPRTVRDKE